MENFEIIELEILKGQTIESINGYVYNITSDGILEILTKLGFSGDYEVEEAIENHIKEINDNDSKIQEVFMDLNTDSLIFILNGKRRLDIEVAYQQIVQIKLQNKAYLGEQTIDKIIND